MTSVADPMLYSNVNVLRRELPSKNWEQTVNRDWPSFRDDADRVETIAQYEDETQRIHDIYTHAFYGNHRFFLLGSRDTRSDIDLVQNIGVLCSYNTGLPKKAHDTIMDLLNSVSPTPSPSDESDDQAVSDYQTQLDAWEEERVKFFSRGSILNEKDWWPMMNDFAMLGVIHRGREVHLALNGIPEVDELWDAANKRFRVMGREIAMLRAAGYRPYLTKVGPNTSQLIFLPPEISSSSLTYTDARKAIKTASVDDIFDYLDNAGVISNHRGDDYKGSPVDDEKE